MRYKRFASYLACGGGDDETQALYRRADNFDSQGARGQHFGAETAFGRPLLWALVECPLLAVSRCLPVTINRTESVPFAVRDRYQELMTRSIKAALLSGLIFPGLGHMVLKQYLRGAVLMLSALAALSVIVTNAIKQALAIVDRINNGEIPLEPGAIAELASISASGVEGSIMEIAALVVGAVWIVGIVDSYRLGIIQEK
jgi:hypothetical protein